MHLCDADAKLWKEGETTSFTKTITESDLRLFEGLSEGPNRWQAEVRQPPTSDSERRSAPSLLIAGLVSDAVGQGVPAGAMIDHRFSFLSPIYVGDTVTILASVGESDQEGGRLLLETVCCNQSGAPVATGRTEIRYRG